MSAKNGLAAVIEAAGGAGSAPGARPEQLPLLEPAPAATAEPLPARGPGRPRGSRNARTREWQRWFSATGKLPLEFLAETFRMPLQALATELGCEKAEALRIQVTAATACLPYLEQKLPLAVEDVSETNRRPVIVVGTLSGAQIAGAEQRLGLRLKSPENQHVIEAKAEQSDGAEVGQVRK